MKNSDLRSLFVDDYLDGNEPFYEFDDEEGNLDICGNFLYSTKKIVKNKSGRFCLPIIKFDNEEQIQNRLFNLISKAGNKHITIFDKFSCIKCGSICYQQCNKKYNELDKIVLLFESNLMNYDYSLKAIIMSPNNKFKDCYKEATLDCVDFRLCYHNCAIYLFDKCPDNMIYGISEPEYAGAVIASNSKVKSWQHRNNIKKNIIDDYTTCGLGIFHPNGVVSFKIGK